MLGVKPKPSQTFDGISIVPALKQSGPLAQEGIFCYFPHYNNNILAGSIPSAYVRSGDWKLIRLMYDGPHFAHRYELYNLKDDVGETNNLAAQMPGKVKELDALIERFLISNQAVLPKPNPIYNPLVGPWEPSKESRLAVRNSRLIVETLKGHPSLMTRDVPPAKGPLTLELRMRSAAKGPGRIFWATKGDKKAQSCTRRTLRELRRAGR